MASAASGSCAGRIVRCLGQDRHLRTEPRERLRKLDGDRFRPEHDQVLGRSVERIEDAVLVEVAGLGQAGDVGHRRPRPGRDHEPMAVHRLRFVDLDRVVSLERSRAVVNVDSRLRKRAIGIALRQVLCHLRAVAMTAAKSTAIEPASHAKAVGSADLCEAFGRLGEHLARQGRCQAPPAPSPRRSISATDAPTRAAAVAR